MEKTNARETYRGILADLDALGFCRPAEAIDGLIGTVERLEGFLMLYEEDYRRACGELAIPVPEPGTDTARLLAANMILRGERDTARLAYADVRRELDEARAQLRAANETAEGVRLDRDLLRRAVAAQNERGGS